jgi:hypothetical protein
MDNVAVTTEWSARRGDAGAESRTIKIRPVHGIGAGWFGGWMFTIGFAKLVWWKALFGLVIWPFYLGTVLR